MDKISLNASMRSNLLSLQNISKAVSHTQNKLSTGLKVNSAIDNPSSYYTARSLSNRARDLTALLDSMGQAIQTIKAATTGLETGAELLAQASAVATKALETATIPAKSWFEEKVGANGAVVTNADELKQAIADNKETICVYGKINIENESLTLKDGQKLVGTEYYTGYSGKEKFSEVNFFGNMASGIRIDKKDILISDLKLTCKTESNDSSSFICVDGTEARLNNLDISFDASYAVGDAANGAILGSEGAIIDFSGIININGNGSFGGGIFLYNRCVADIDKDAIINLKTHNHNSSRNRSIEIYGESALNLYGRVNIDTTDAAIYLAEDNYSKNVLNTYVGSEINVKSPTGSAIFARCGNQENKVNFGVGTKISIKNDNKVDSFVAINDDNYSTTSDMHINKNLLSASANFAETENDVDWDKWMAELHKDEKESEANINAKNSQQYSEILTQYDTMIKDAGYKGVNLISNDTLNVRFNENSSSNLNVVGKDMSTETIGLNKLDWQTQGDIAQSIKELASALNQIRSFQSELGNSYSIITNRQEFTESLINVLTEGADKLTLADMNEESANMLALQTRQQLAVNALSLASQASQGILKLF